MRTGKCDLSPHQRKCERRGHDHARDLEPLDARYRSLGIRCRASPPLPAARPPAMRGRPGLGTAGSRPSRLPHPWRPPLTFFHAGFAGGFDACARRRACSAVR
eukprot:365555-Chlamydomonas_euryale.AAC.7